MTALAPSLQAYFTDRLIGQRAASPNTIAAYKLTFRLLLTFASNRAGKTPTDLDIAELDAPLIAAFLDHLERDRHNSAATRNNRLAAIHSLFGYLALHHPEHAGSIQRVLAIPTKRTERNLLTYLTEPEVDALLDACDRHLDRTARSRHVRAHHPDRATDLRARRTHPRGRHAHHRRQRAHHRQRQKGATHTAGPTTRALLQAWLGERPGDPTDPLFPTTTGDRPQPRRHRTTPRPPPRTARANCPSLRGKHVTMHTLRHTAAMRLLLAGNDVTVIALWLGHEQIATTNIYLHADMTHKQQAIDRTKPPLPSPAATGPPTRSSRSSKPSDYADKFRTDALLTSEPLAGSA